MAVYFGQGATYDSMHGRFREYRRMADTMQGATGGPVTTPTSRRTRTAPSTPRSRGGITKSSSSKKKQTEKRYLPSHYNTTSRKGVKTENPTPETIILDDNDEDEDDDLLYLKNEDGARSNFIKSENGASMGDLDVFGIKEESQFVDSRMNGYITPNRNPNSQSALRVGAVTDNQPRWEPEYDEMLDVA